MEFSLAVSDAASFATHVCIYCSFVTGQALTTAAAAAVTARSPHLSLVADIDMLVTY